MDGYLWWAIAGMALIITELVTGTFYLLVIGVAALAGAAVAYAGYALPAQALVAAAIAIVGVTLVTRRRAASSAVPGLSLDVGQSVVLDTWVSEAERQARVRYRNAQWDATVLGTEPAKAGQTLYIRHVEGSRLHVSTHRPG